MSRILRFALLGLVLAVPFVLPAASQAAGRYHRGRTVTTCRPYSCYHWYGHRHVHYRHCR
jgi:hypothetical protein